MATGDFDLYYPDHPWAGINKNQRVWYDPYLRDFYRDQAVFGQFTTFKQSLADVRAKTMVITGKIDTHPNFNPIGHRQIWMNASYVDSKSLEITFNRYGGKVAYDEYDDLITYWRDSSGSGGALQSILNDQLGFHMTQVLDYLSRNALLEVPYARYLGSDKTQKFAGISATDTMTKLYLDQVHLGMKFRRVPYAVNPMAGGRVGTIVCVTSPGVIYDLQNNTDPKDWLSIMQYADPQRLLKYEVGMFRNVRFVETEKCVLWNCGTITAQYKVTSPINAGDGAPATEVDGVYTVGQSGATPYIQLENGADMANFSLDQIVTIHVLRTSDFGVTNGVDYRDGLLHNLRIVEIDSVNKRLSFETPLMEDFVTDIEAGGGVTYAYVTSGLHVHSSIFIGGPNAVVQGVGRPVRLHMPRPVDDFDQIWRMSWDGRIGYAPFNPRVCETIFSAGSVRYIGDMLQ